MHLTAIVRSLGIRCILPIRENNDFEPKFSLMPLSFGTLKAAFYAMLFAMPAAIFSAPLEVVDEIAGNGIDSAEDEIILSVSTIVNGVKKSEATEIASELERLGEDIKNAAFEVFMFEVTQKAMTVDEVKNAVEAVKVRAIR